MFLRNPEVSASFKHPLTACVKIQTMCVYFWRCGKLKVHSGGTTTVALLSGFLHGAVVDEDHVKKKRHWAMVV